MKTALLLILSAAAVLLGGCNTVAGIGKDVQRGGQAIQNAAK